MREKHCVRSKSTPEKKLNKNAGINVTSGTIHRSGLARYAANLLQATVSSGAILSMDFLRL